MAEAKRVKDMTAGSPTRLILYFSIPLLIGNIFQQLYNMVDTIIVGRCIDTNALAAVGLTGPLSFLVIGFVTGLTSGFAVLVAQRFGARDEEGMRHCVGIIVILSVGMTLLITLLSVSFAKPLLRLINTPDNVIEQSWRYIVTIFSGIFATVLYNVLACILRALGDSRTPLYFLMISSLLNIGLDLLFITQFGLGVRGAALATVLSQGVSGVLCFVYIKKKFPILRLSRRDFGWDGRLALKHLGIGLPMAFQFSITAIGVIVLQGALNLFGEEKIAAYTAASKVEQLVSQPAGTFGVAMANYAGQNLGAAKIDRIRRGVRQATILTLCFAVFGMLVMTLFGGPLTRLFIKSENAAQVEEIIAASLQYLRISAAFFPFLFVIFIYRNALQGIGHSFMPLMGGVAELVVRCVAAFVLPGLFGFTGVCLAGPLAWVSAAVLLCVSWFVIIRRVERQYALRPRGTGTL
ncbi:MAG: MATE family efflux transporter [Lachnospiraceae bacterium]|nr:MATE family efflux transporter [Lachnospiraceae bacterium]